MSPDGPTSGQDQLGEVVQRARRALENATAATSRASDPGVALIEVLALVGDLLSRYAELVADEAYLGGASHRWPPLAQGPLELNVGVEVDGGSWERVQDLTQSGPEDSHYLVREGDHGASVVEFGDGVHGQRPPGDSDIVVRYRDGAGKETLLRLAPGRVILNTDWGGTAPACGVFRARVLDNIDPLMQHRLRVVAPSLHGDEAVWAMACLPVGAADETPAPGDVVWIALEQGDPDNLVWLGRVSAL